MSKPILNFLTAIILLVSHLACAQTDTSALLTNIADRLVTQQTTSGTAKGSWPGETAYTGIISAGLVKAYQATGDSDYLTAARLGAEYFEKLAAGNYLGDEAYCLALLSETSSNPASNKYRTRLTNYFTSIKNSSGGTASYLNYFASVNPSDAVYYVSYLTVAADYVQATDRSIFISYLVYYLSLVTDSTANYPVGAQALATWSLAKVDSLDSSLVDASAQSGDFWYGIKLSDLPVLVAAHQIPQTDPLGGSFYWLFGHNIGIGRGQVNGGFLEDSVFSVMALTELYQQTRASEYLSIIQATRSVLAGAITDDYFVYDHISSDYYSETHYIYASELISALISLPQPLEAQFTADYTGSSVTAGSGYFLGINASVFGSNTSYLAELQVSYDNGSTYQPVTTLDLAQVNGTIWQPGYISIAQAHLRLVSNQFNRILDHIGPFAIYLPDYSLTTTISGSGTITATPDTSLNAIAAGSSITLTAQPGTGYYFSSWQDTQPSDTVSGNQVAVFMDANRSITAVFLPIPVSLTATTTTGGTVSVPAGTYSYGQQVTVTATATYGYQLIGWQGTDNNTSTALTNTVTLTGLQTVSALFQRIPAAVSVSITAGQGGYTISDDTLYVNDTITLTASPAYGYELIGWYYQDQLISDQTSWQYQITGDKQFDLRFALKQYDINVSVGSGSGQVNLDSAIVTHGQTLALAATAQPGYQFRGWYDQDDNLLSKQSQYDLAPTSDLSILARFDQIAYPLTISKVTVKAGSSRDIPGDSVAVTATLTPEFLAAFNAYLATSDTTPAVSISLYHESYTGNFGITEQLDPQRTLINRSKTRLSYSFPVKTTDSRKISRLSLDFSKGTISFSAIRATLSGLQSPLIIKLQLDNFLAIGYAGETTADYLQMGQDSTLAKDVINGSKSTPISLLKGVKDKLVITSGKAGLSNRANSDYVKISGELSVADLNTALTTTGMKVETMGLTIDLAASEFKASKNKRYYTCKRAATTASPAISASFDLDKCRFSIVITRAEIETSTENSSLSLTFGTFSESSIF